MDGADPNPSLNIGQVLRYAIGCLLLLLGVGLALYVVLAVVNIINAEDPPPLVRQLSGQMAERVEQAAAGGPQPQAQPLDLAPDLKRGIFYGAVFLFLSLPTTIACALLAAGGRLLLTEANEALQKIAAKIRSGDLTD